VDGLDECEPESQEIILQQLQKTLSSSAVELADNSTALHVLITSQRTREVDSKRHYFHQIRIDTADVTPDIVTLIETRLNEIIPDETESETIRDLIQDRLKEGAKGTFLWTSFLLDELEGLKDQITINDILNILKSLPQGLEGYYTRVLERISEQNQAKAAIILSILLSTKRTLRLKELAVAFHFLSSSNSYTRHSELNGNLLLDIRGHAKKLCMSFVKTTDTHIEISHQSAREYLLALPSNINSLLLERFRYEPQVAHDRMAMACLQFLLLENFTEEEKSYPFISYACDHWPDHVRESGDRLVECRPSLERFLKKDSLNLPFQLNLNSKSDGPLHTLIKHRLLNVIKRIHTENRDLSEDLLNIDIDINERNSSGETAIYTAAKFNNIEILRQLLNAKADPSAPTKRGLAPIHLAAENDRIDVLEELINYDVDVCAKSKSGLTSLHYAARNGHVEMVDRLVELNVDLNQQDNDGRTALHFAARNGHVNVVDRLVEHKVDLNQ
jgi:hypothetical protein